MKFKTLRKRFYCERCEKLTVHEFDMPEGYIKNFNPQFECLTCGHVSFADE